MVKPLQLILQHIKKHFRENKSTDTLWVHVKIASWGEDLMLICRCFLEAKLEREKESQIRYYGLYLKRYSCVLPTMLSPLITFYVLRNQTFIWLLNIY